MQRICTTLLLFMIVISSCKEQEPLKKEKPEFIVSTPRIDTVFIKQEIDSSIYQKHYMIDRLPKWVLNMEGMNELIINTTYRVENRINPMYLEDDFNGDGIIDIALPIAEIITNKKGFAVIHGGTLEVFIIGSGVLIKNALGDDLDYIDIWRINRNKLNEPGTEEIKPLILKNHSIEIEKSEVGGGQIFWNGKEYEYFHQTC